MSTSGSEERTTMGSLSGFSVRESESWSAVDSSLKLRPRSALSGRREESGDRLYQGVEGHCAERGDLRTRAGANSEGNQRVQPEACSRLRGRGDQGEGSASSIGSPGGRTSGSKKNPAGFLYRSITDDFSLPADYRAATAPRPKAPKAWRAPSAAVCASVTSSPPVNTDRNKIDEFWQALPINEQDRIEAELLKTAPPFLRRQYVEGQKGKRLLFQTVRQAIIDDYVRSKLASVRYREVVTPGHSDHLAGRRSPVCLYTAVEGLYRGIRASCPTIQTRTAEQLATQFWRRTRSNTWSSALALASAHCGGQSVAR